jgi:hypothetical protein
MKLLVLSLFVFLIFIGSIIYFNETKTNVVEGFQGKPPNQYLDLLPSSSSDIQKITANRNGFKTQQIKRYFPELIKKQTIQKPGMLPIKIDIIDPVGIVAVAWKVADELNQNNITQRNLLSGLQKSLDKSKETLKLVKEKCKL